MRENVLLSLRYLSVAYRNGDSRLGGVLEAESLYLIQHFRSVCRAVLVYAFFYDIRKLTLLYEEAYLEVELLVGVGSVNISQILRDIFVEYQPADSSVDYLRYLSVAELLCDLYLDGSVQGNYALIVSHKSFVHVAEDLSLAGLALFLKSEVVRTKDHILRRYCNGASV